MSWQDVLDYETQIGDLEADKTAKQAEITQLNTDITTIDASIAAKQALCDQALLDHDADVQAKKIAAGL